MVPVVRVFIASWNREGEKQTVMRQHSECFHGKNTELCRGSERGSLNTHLRVRGFPVRTDGS